MARRSKKRPQAERRPRNRQPKDWQWWVLAAGVPLMLCAGKLSLDLWSDEAYTLMFFVSRPFREIATDYSAPNNHVAYSLLLRPFYLVSDSNLMLRLPSLLFSAGALAMVFRMTRRGLSTEAGRGTVPFSLHENRDSPLVGSLAAAVSATLVLGLTQMFLGHTMQVRGYGLSIFLAAWLGDLAAARKTSWATLGTTMLVGAVFLYTLPSNALFLLPLGAAAVAWAAIRDRSWRAAVVTAGAWATACGLAALAYLPIAEDVLKARGQPVAEPLWSAVGLTRQVFSVATRDWLPLVPLVALGLVIWMRKVWKEPSREHAALPLVVLAGLVGPFLMTALLAARPFPRNYCPMLPFLAIGIGWPLAELVGAAGRLLRSRWTETATAVVGMALLATVALPRIASYPARLAEVRRSRFAQDGYYNYYAAEFHPADVVAYLQATIPDGQSYLVCFSDADHFALAHYFGRAGLPPTQLVEGSPPVIYVIAPELADYHALAAKFDLSADFLRALPLVQDFGYYRLQRCDAEVLSSSRRALDVR